VAIAGPAISAASMYLDIWMEIEGAATCDEARPSWAKILHPQLGQHEQVAA
jgi:hypothetical protein